MSSATLNLGSPIQLGDVSLRNRNVMASLTRNRSVPTTIPNDANKEYYVQRAESAGLVLTEGTLISHQGSEWPNAPGIFSDEHVQAWKKITEEMHRVGGKTFIQLWHIGRAANNDMPEQKQSGHPVPSASAIPIRGGEGHFRTLEGKPGYSIPQPLEDPDAVIEEYRQAAENAKKAGFDGVELHSANGYLVSQFLDSTSNKRTDEWGGSIENRCRFGLKALDALIDVYGAGKVGIKINPCGGYNDVGMPLQEAIDTYTHYIKELLARNIAYIQLVRYLPAMDPEIEGKKRATTHDVLATYGPLIKSPSKPSITTKLLLNGALAPEEANDLVGRNLIDGAVFGTLWIGNPDLQTRIEKGLPINEKPETKLFYAFPDNNPRRGYSDYPKVGEKETSRM